MDSPIVVTLMSLAQGAAAEVWQAELDKVLENIQDPNTEPEAIRTITLTVGIQPDAEREQAEVIIKTSSKMAAIKKVATRIHFGRHQGQLVAVEAPKPTQMGLFTQPPVLNPDVAVVHSELVEKKG